MNYIEFEKAIALIVYLMVRGRFQDAWAPYRLALIRLYPDRIFYNGLRPVWFDRMLVSGHLERLANQALFRDCESRIWQEIGKTIRLDKWDHVHHMKGEIPRYWVEHPVEYYLPFPGDLESLPRKVHENIHRNLVGAITVKMPPPDDKGTR